MLSADVLTLIYSELQYRKDIISFKLTCKLWNSASKREDADSLRWNKQRLSCTLLDGISFSCCKIGEFTCEVCNEEDLCSDCATIECVRCERLVGPACLINNAPVCFECCGCCELCGEEAESFLPFVAFRSLHFMYCPNSDSIMCGNCRKNGKCCQRAWKLNEHHYVSDYFFKIKGGGIHDLKDYSLLTSGTAALSKSSNGS